MLLAGLLSLAALLCGCTPRSALRVDLLAGVGSQESYLEGVHKIRKSAKLYGKLNQFLYWFDQGLLFHYAGEYDSSIVCLQQARQVQDDLYARSISNEALSLLTNDNLRPYRGRRYEQVLLHQLLSFDYLAKGELDEALVETRQVQQVFQRFQDKDRGADKYHDDGMAHYLSSIIYDASQARDDAAISLYEAVRAYRGGPIGVPAAVANLAYYRLLQDGRDADVAQLQLQPTDSLERIDGVDRGTSEIILIGQAGQGPVMGETVFWGTWVVGGVITIYYVNPATQDTAFTVLPAPPLPEEEIAKLNAGEENAAGTTFHLKFAMPCMVSRPSETDHFTARLTDGKEDRPSIMLSDVERLLRQDLEDNFNATLLRTALRVVLRTIAAQKTKKELESGSPWLNLAVNLGTDVLADQLEKADTRLSFLLPRSLHITRLAVAPGTHAVEATARDQRGDSLGSRVWENVKVAAGQKVFLFYPSLK
jgi:hypothetical protein